MKHTIYIAILIMTCFAGVALSAEKDVPKNEAVKTTENSAPSRQEPEKVEKAPVSPITKAAVNAGALTCAARVDQVVGFLSTGSTGVGANLYVPAANPDRGLATISFEIALENMPSTYANASFAPNQANGCGAMYETVAYWNMKCGEVVEKQFAGLKSMGVLSKDITALDGGSELKIFLMPAGSGGCVSIKREVVR